MSQRDGKEADRRDWMVVIRVRIEEGGRAQKTRQWRGSIWLFVFVVLVGAGFWWRVRAERMGSTVKPGKVGERRRDFCWALRVVRWVA